MKPRVWILVFGIAILMAGAVFIPFEAAIRNASFGSTDSLPKELAVLENQSKSKGVELIEIDQALVEKRQEVRKSLSENFKRKDFPAESEFEFEGQRRHFKLGYTFDDDLQLQMQKMLNQYKPDYGAIVALEPKTGKVLALVSFEKRGDDKENLALKASFPAASIFKVVTASAAIDRYDLSPDFEIAFNGGNWTLYKKNVLHNNTNRWTRSISFKEAFARSINTVFGKIGIEYLEPGDLEEYAKRYNFNKEIPSDLPIETGFAEIPHEDYALAEIASGFNKINKMSPIQGAMIAAAVIQDGTMKAPYVVDTITNDQGEVVYQGQPLAVSNVVSPASAEKLRELMTETVTNGTSRKIFRKLIGHKEFEGAEFGGKTGSLHGDEPKGKCDWFVGYGKFNDKEIAVAAITVNVDRWTVKSSYLAQSAMMSYLSK